jgi:hypothetical protein
MAWTRASNAAIMYLDKDAITDYCPGAMKKPGGGAYEAVGLLDPVTGISTAEFRKCGTSHFHEAVWIATHKQTKKLYQAIQHQSSERKPTPNEVISLRGLALFDGLNFGSPLAWPSKLRNGINYRPGFSYRSVVRNNFLRISSRLAKPTLNDLEAVVSYGEHAKNAIRGFDDPSDVANECVDLLIAQMIFLEAHTEEAFLQVCEMQGLQCSAFRQRRAFVRNNAIVESIISPIL